MIANLVLRFLSWIVDMEMWRTENGSGLFDRVFELAEI